MQEFLFILEKKIKFLCLWDDEQAKKRASSQKLVSGRILPKGFQSDSVVNIFGNKVAIVLFKERYPSAFLIENKEVANSFRKWFELLWKASK